MSTGQCEKCRSEIPTQADRCPDCGHEPSSIGLLGKLLGIAAFAVFSFCILLLIIIPITLIDGLAISTAAITFGVFIIGAAISGGYLYGLYKKTQQKPIENPT